MHFNDKNKLWFISDTHFNHENIIKYQRSEDFENLAQMNETLVWNWNSVVNHDDTIICLGDFCFGDQNNWEYFRNQLQGNIVLVKGNHDRPQDEQLQRLFSNVSNYLEITVNDEDACGGKQKIVCFHYPILSFNCCHHGAWHVYGHVHGNQPEHAPTNSFNCSVENIGYTPISYNQLKNNFNQ